LEANWALIASQKNIFYFLRCDFILQIEILAKTNQQLLNNEIRLYHQEQQQTSKMNTNVIH